MFCLQLLWSNSDCATQLQHYTDPIAESLTHSDQFFNLYLTAPPFAKLIAERNPALIARLFDCVEQISCWINFDPIFAKTIMISMLKTENAVLWNMLDCNAIQIAGCFSNFTDVIDLAAANEHFAGFLFLLQPQMMSRLVPDPQDIVMLGKVSKLAAICRCIAYSTTHAENNSASAYSNPDSFLSKFSELSILALSGIKSAVSLSDVTTETYPDLYDHCINDHLAGVSNIINTFDRFITLVKNNEQMAFLLYTQFKQFKDHILLMLDTVDKVNTLKKINYSLTRHMVHTDFSHFISLLNPLHIPKDTGQLSADGVLFLLTEDNGHSQLKQPQVVGQKRFFREEPEQCAPVKKKKCPSSLETHSFYTNMENTGNPSYEPSSSINDHQYKKAF